MAKAFVAQLGQAAAQEQADMDGVEPMDTAEGGDDGLIFASIHQHASSPSDSGRDTWYFGLVKEHGLAPKPRSRKPAKETKKRGAPESAGRGGSKKRKTTVQDDEEEEGAGGDGEDEDEENS
ncbi:hypothetical protein LTR36_005408 [Oleoguttula mirabilis]|uniref:Uncharacterized protein n=1 Tax=Oleoguttula mirabilis TaxID=1507867 RepID=A0AAV9JE21_9PEZI|nr:hypothetical protein LTR36_005408 [Oleoguttula mirabilis]